jgi:hypothetical protein
MSQDQSESIDTNISPIYRADGTYIIIEPSTFSRFHPRSSFGISGYHTRYRGRCPNINCPYYKAACPNINCPYYKGYKKIEN